MEFVVDIPAGLEPESWQWDVTGAPASNLTSPKITVDVPSAAGAQVVVSVVVNFVDGCSSSGRLTIRAVTAEEAGIAIRLCELRRLDYGRPPILPVGPDPAWRSYSVRDLERIGSLAERLVEGVRAALGERSDER
jgi:hypothetical protein